MTIIHKETSYGKILRKYKRLLCSIKHTETTTLVFPATEERKLIAVVAVLTYLK